METCAAMGHGPRWFQLYWNGVDAVMESFVRRAEACRCRAIVLTLDTTMLAWRPRDLDLAYLPFLHGRGIAQYTGDPAFRAGLAEPFDGEPPAAAVSITWASLKALFGAARRYPGSLLANLRSVGQREGDKLLQVAPCQVVAQNGDRVRQIIDGQKR